MPKRTAKSEKTTVQIDTKLLKEAQGKLDERGLAVEKYISLFLRVLVNSPGGTVNLKHKMPFGKYSGEVVEDVCRADPNYMEWLLAQNNKSCSFDDGVFELVIKLRS